MWGALFVIFQLLSVGSTVLAGSTQAQTPPPLLARPSPEVTPSVTVKGEDCWKFAISHPAPEYPIEARRRHLSGVGVFELQLEDSGEVRAVTVISSTGYSILDRAAVRALKCWKFRPHVFSRVKLPITFSLRKKSSESKEKT